MSHPATRLAVLGSTGSIGTQTLDVVARLRQQSYPIRVSALAARGNSDRLAEQIEAFNPAAAGLADAAGATRLRARFPEVRVYGGEDAAAEIARGEDVDTIVNAMVGAAGLAATLAALERGRTVALANKESLVAGGVLVRRALTRGGRLVPVDSEHSAIFQCLGARRKEEVSRVILTASGGPFLGMRRADRASVTAADALHHPTWSMGKRISVDSATLANKAFEVIEAHHLFELPLDRIAVVIHPGSLIHAFVEFVDGSVLAQAAAPDMRIPIQYALTHPARVGTGLPRLDVSALRGLELRTIDPEEFPAFTTILAAAREGGTAPAAVNAADEALVARFLAGDIGFDDIAAGLAAVLDRWRVERVQERSSLDLGSILAADRWARRLAASLHS